MTTAMTGAMTLIIVKDSALLSTVLSTMLPDTCADTSMTWLTHVQLAWLSVSL